MRTAYIYAGPAADAARHILTHSALQYVTTAEEFWHADDECTKVTLDTPRPSEGERILWDALSAFATDLGGFDMGMAAAKLDAENLRVLLEAVGLRFRLDVEAVAS